MSVGLGGLGDLFIGDAAAAHLGLGVHGEHHQANLLLAVVGHRLGNGGAAAVLEVLVGGAVVLLAVVVKRVPAAHLGVGVDVDGDQIGVVHACLLGWRPPVQRQTPSMRHGA